MTITATATETFVPPSPESLSVEELREWAIDLNVEVHKCHRGGWFDGSEAPVIRLAHDVLMAAHRNESSTSLGAEIDLRYATYLLQARLPGFEETIALDGDLEHPENGRGEKVYRPRRVALADAVAA